MGIFLSFLFGCLFIFFLGLIIMFGIVQKNRGGTFTSNLNKITRRYIKKRGILEQFITLEK